MRICHTRDLMNPVFPYFMEGYNEERFTLNHTEAQKKAGGSGMRTAQGIRDDLLLDTLLMESGKLVVFFTLDIVIAEKEFTDYCAKRVSEACDLPMENICVSASHTHNSPLTSHGMDYNLKPDLGYWEYVADKMVAAVKFAKKHLQPVKVFTDEFHINGYYNNRNRPTEEYFDRCTELTFKTEDGITLLRLLNIACHPTLLGVQNKAYTADFFGVMRRYIQGIDGTPVMIFNGEAGDVSPRLMKKGVDWNECVRYGEALGAQLLYPNHPKEVVTEDVDIRTIVHDIDYVPAENTFLTEKLKELEERAKHVEPGTREYKMVNQVMLYDVKEKLTHDRLTYTANCMIYDFGGFRIVTVPCEIDSVLGKQIRVKDDKPTLLNAYANGFLYYAVNKEEFGDVFESFVTYFPYGDADEMVEDILKQYK